MLCTENVSKKLRLDSATFGLRPPIVSATGWFDEDLAIKADRREVKITGAIQCVVADR